MEWNNAYCKKWQRSINEIIEIGAVKLNDALEIVGEFSELIKPDIGKKLSGRFISLCNISNEDIQNGLPFNEAMERFGRFIGNSDECIVMTWGDTDIRVMIDNFRYFKNTPHIPFMKNYVDLQSFCQSQAGLGKAQQIGLGSFARLMEISDEEYSLHRAYDDSALSAKCLKAVFDKDRLMSVSRKCNGEFYRRMNFRTHYIADINSPFVDKSKLMCFCDVCGRRAEQKSEWKFYSKGFSAFFYCNSCKRDMRYTVRCKRYFDRVETKTRLTPILKEPDGEKRE